MWFTILDLGSEKLLIFSLKRKYSSFRHVKTVAVDDSSLSSLPASALLEILDFIDWRYRGPAVTKKRHINSFHLEGAAGQLKCSLSLLPSIPVVPNKGFIWAFFHTCLKFGWLTNYGHVDISLNLGQLGNPYYNVLPWSFLYYLDLSSIKI